ncbi:tRNA pseudouridine synthase [Spironucleus salmonicida]|uniref:tRNA pseudouridine synthase n=1 Tax=Spironucleus salmonicida TaxID=348837 RepID=V6LYE9_9EUKA|nr:tRNA pseudouridine synthase [Spironucleus salmonicida]|eukprot:EST49268.1 Pseudouridylate synthase [Spironucleus salmonicida]
MVKTIHKLIALAYIGENYSGSAIQPSQTKVKTIELELINALVKSGLARDDDLKRLRLDRVSRTDKGVSAASALFTVDCEPLDNFDETLNSSLPADIRCIGSMRVVPKYNGRQMCSSRYYEYLFPLQMLFPTRQIDEKYNENLLTLPDTGDFQLFKCLVTPVIFKQINCPEAPEDQIKIFDEQILENLNRVNQLAFLTRAVHYHNFAPSDSFNAISATLRKMLQIEFQPAKIENGIAYSKLIVHGQSFLYNQIRNMAGAIATVAQGYAPAGWIVHAVFGKACYKAHIVTAPGKFLLLKQQLFQGYDTRPEYGIYGQVLSERAEVMTKADEFSDIIKQAIFSKKENCLKEINWFNAELAKNSKDLFQQTLDCIDNEYKTKALIEKNKVIQE